LGRLSLIIADNDTEYLENLEKFLLINYPQRFELFSFCSAEKLSDFLTRVQSADILLISRHLYESGMNTAKAKLVLLLSEDIPAGTPKAEKLTVWSGSQPEKNGRQFAEVSDKYETVYRYQHMDKLVSEIIRLFSGRSLKNVSISGHGCTRIVGVLSPSGGTGSSSIAAGCSILCAGKGIKSFYLNLEAIPSTDQFFCGDCPQTFSNVIYYLKGKYGNLQLRLEGAKCVDTKSGVHYFKPPENIRELSELTDREVATLVSELKKSAFYSYIFIDLSAGLNTINSSILQLSDAILLVLSPERRTMMKLSNLKAGLDLLEHKGGSGLTDRIIPILNRADTNSGHFTYQIPLPGGRPLTQIVDCSCSNAAASGVFSNPAAYLDSAAVPDVPVENKAFLTALNGIIDNLSFCSATEESQCNGGEHIA
jgi:MinD-like ATPase involved in chromosome partitioning or flagellar assembly